MLEKIHAKELSLFLKNNFNIRISLPSELFLIKCKSLNTNLKLNFVIYTKKSKLFGSLFWFSYLSHNIESTIGSIPNNLFFIVAKYKSNEKFILGYSSRPSFIPNTICMLNDKPFLVRPVSISKSLLDNSIHDYSGSFVVLTFQPI